MVALERASNSRLRSLNGTSIGRPTSMLPCAGVGTRSSAAGNGQSGLVALGTIRVCDATPTVSVTALPSILGWAAKAFIGFTSSHSLGRPVAPPPSGIERHIFAHCARAARSMKGSLRSRASSAPI